MDAADDEKISTNVDAPPPPSESAPVPTPAPIPSANAPPPFLVKTYDMVDDASTDKIVSWSSTDNSFVVWDLPGFTKELLPKYFKHNNFSSFVRQLNTYGFKKVDSDRWEFANEYFLRGQWHLLKSIIRRKPVHGHNQRPQQSNGQNSSVGPCVEVGKFGLEEEVERLQRDKNVLMQELVRLRQQQQTTDNHLQAMVQRIQGMEQRQQQMMSFLAKAANSPGFLAQFVGQQNEVNKKRRLRQDGVAPVDRSMGPTDSQIVKYQPLMNEKMMLGQVIKFEGAQRVETLSDGADGFLISDVSSPSSGSLDHHVDSSSTTTPGVTIHEVPPKENFVETKTEDGAVLDPISLDLGNFSPDADIEWDPSLLDDIFSTEPSWEQLLALSPQAAEAEPMDSVASAEENESKPLANGLSSKDQMSQLTKQMGLLRSDTEKV